MEKKVLIINEPNYKEITEMITEHAVNLLSESGIDSVIMGAPDIIELPIMLKYHLKAAELRTLENRYSGYILLGCSEFGSDIETLKQQRMLIQEIESMKLQYSLALGYGIFSPKDKTHGLEWGKTVTTNAVDRCVQLLDIKRKLGL